MIRVGLLSMAILLAVPANAAPPSWSDATLGALAADRTQIAALDLEKVRIEDQASIAEGETPRFAVAHEVELRPDATATLKDGSLLWLHEVQAEGALSINVAFHEFQLAKGAELWLYSPDRKQVVGPLTHADNDAHRQYWSPVILGDRMVIELRMTRAAAKTTKLALTQINQGYRFFGSKPTSQPVSDKSGMCDGGVPKPGTPLSAQLGKSGQDKSGSCNMDVACLNSNDPWRQVADSVGAYTRNGTQICSGALINNTALDRRMLFMTADHCGNSAANAPSVVIYWNYESPTCRTPGSSASGAAQAPYPSSNANSGTIFLSDHATSDFNLLETDDPPPASARLYWMGWDRTPYVAPGGAGNGDAQCSAGSMCAGIHHPGVDEKRITFVEQPMLTTSYFGTAPPGNASHIYVFWDPTPVFPPNPGQTIPPQVTEGGSSGSPLFNANFQFIGQLHGGLSACGSTGANLTDYYGRLSVSWEGGGTAATRARDYLDPVGSAPITLNGLAPSSGDDVFANGFE